MSVNTLIPLQDSVSLHHSSLSEFINRQDAKKILDLLKPQVINIPCSLSAEFMEGWMSAFDTLSQALKLEEYG